LRDLPTISGFRIVQETLTLTRVEVVPAAGYDARVRDAIIAGVRARLGAAVEVDVREVAVIPPERSGKYRYVISKVGH
jgi:phenylacetate-CoA ligase